MDGWFLFFFVFVVTLVSLVVVVIAAGVIWVAYFGKEVINEDFKDITDDHKGARF